MVPHKFYRLINMTVTTSFVTGIYIVTKILYFVNVLIQFNLLNK